MRRLIIALLIHVVLASLVCADGLIYQLPCDGAFARFEMVMTSTILGIKDDLTGVCTVSSAGKEVVDDTPCRWIEINTVCQRGKESKAVIVKTLIPEKHLGQGKDPLKHMVRGWSKEDQRNAIAVKSVKWPLAAGALQEFLPPPLKDVTKLPKMVVENALGKVECEGLSGTGAIDCPTTKIESGRVTRVYKAAPISYSVRLHKDAPFGVVWAEIDLRLPAGNDRIKWTLKLVEIGKGAKSALPDKN